MQQPPGKTVFRFRPREQRVVLIIGDLLFPSFALIIALYLWGRGDEWLKFSLDFLEQRVPLWFYLLPMIWIVMLVDLYDLHRAGNWRQTIRGVFVTALAGFLLYSLVYLVSEPGSLPRRGTAAFLAGASVLTLVWRLIYIRIYTTPALMRRMLIVGAGETGKSLARIYRDLWPPPFYLVGFIDDDPRKIGAEIAGFNVLAGSDKLLQLITDLSISDIIVAISGELKGATFQALLDAQELGIEITRMPRLYEELLGRVPVLYLESDWVIRAFVDEARPSAFYDIVKRFLDIIGAIGGLFGFFLLFPFISLSILIDSGLPIFYSQVRSGRGGKPYHIFKIRTMRQDAEKDGIARLAEKDDPRVTRVGNFLRRMRIDELPQFWNVLRGEMSLVGPRAERPELVKDFQDQIPFYRARLLVKPGITGWAQINYDYASSVEDTIVKLEYDLYYIKHRSLIMDFVIMLRTVGTVFGFRGR